VGAAGAGRAPKSDLVKTLVERERELAAIDSLLERGGGVLVVEGRAGIGKTSLVDEACRQAEALGPRS
jgi:MoxR-like ATPase